MLTDEQLRATTRNNLLLGLPAFLTGTGLVLLYFAIGISYLDDFVEYSARNWGYDLAEWLRVASILPCFFLLFAPLLLATLIAQQFPKYFSVFCPHCGANVTQRARMMLFTRTCPKCQKHALFDGKARTEKFYRRYMRYAVQMQMRFFVQTYYLIFLGIGTAALLNGCVGVAIMAGLKGLPFCYWGWSKTRQLRFAIGAIGLLALTTASFVAFLKHS